MSLIRPTIRFAYPEDSVSIVEIMNRTGIGEPHRIEDALLENVLVAVHEEKVVGFSFFVMGRRHAYVDSLAVLPEYGNHGVGYFLHHSMLLYLKNHGVKHVYAGTHPDEGNRVRRMLTLTGWKPEGSIITLSKELEGDLYGKG